MYDVLPAVRVLFLIPSRPAPTLDQPKRWSPEFSDFLEKLLVKDPALRVDAAEALQHPFAARGAASDAERTLVQRHLNDTSVSGSVARDFPSAEQATMRGSSKQSGDGSFSTLGRDASDATLLPGGFSTDDLGILATVELTGSLVDHDTLRACPSTTYGLTHSSFSFMDDYSDGEDGPEGGTLKGITSELERCLSVTKHGTEPVGSSQHGTVKVVKPEGDATRRNFTRPRLSF